jgi:hypothetical protein
LRIPNGAYIILKKIPSAIQQRYGIEAEEGAVWVADSDHDAVAIQQWVSDSGRGSSRRLTT